MLNLIFAFLAFFSVTLAQEELSCENVVCERGFQCDPSNLFGCRGTTCATAFPNPCPTGFECVDIPAECNDNEFCPQFECEKRFDPCAAILCEVGSFCDSNLAQCVPNGCETNCGSQVDRFSFYTNDGEDYCKTCFCLGKGQSFCFPFFGTCPEDKDLSTCPEDEFCLTTCGKEIALGDKFQDDGSNFCNSCTCEPSGIASCTEIFCDQQDPRTSCEDVCFTGCGRAVPVGENYQDEGSNFCNVCSCQEGGLALCTLIACDPDEERSKCPPPPSEEE